MRVARSLLLTCLLLSLGGAVAGCDTLEDFQFWDSKKKLAGDRKPVFPEGVPGVTQGIPPELVKGYQEPQQPGIDPAAVAAQQSAEKADVKPEPKPKPKPRKVAAPRPPAQQAQRPAQQPQGQAGWPAPQPQQPQPQQPQQGQGPAPWPGSQPQAQQQQSPWPTAR
jgi:hypothetical protein